MKKIKLSQRTITGTGQTLKACDFVVKVCLAVAVFE